MTLSPGTRLGSYEITEPVGAGGMGEVYRARDTKLGRDVAIKVLPDELAKDKERLARFEREAKLLAQLNHPNVATLYGFEDGFLVMELVEGETLAERIGRGRIPVEDALPLFIQIAEGLEAAHEKGVIHRDLKPANVKITPEGKVKILDFGLAKAFLPDEGVSAETSQSPTLTKGTALGAIMGTASYMSPEQARGKAVDKRTDIWAFGCCLFEALTAEKAFPGETVSDIIGAVMRAEPDWDAIPLSMRSLVKRCLVKDTRLRMRDIGDVRIQLSEGRGSAEPGPVSNSERRGALVYAAVGLVAGILLATGFFLSSLSEAPVEAPVTRFTVPLPSEIRFDDLSRPILSPDGRYLVTPGESLYLKRMDQLEVKPIAGTEGAYDPFFSPDSRWIGFFSRGFIQRVAVGGGPPVTIAIAPGVTAGASWTEDGDIVFASGGDLWRVSADGGTAERIADVGGEYPKILRPGNAVLLSLTTEDGPRVASVDLETGELDTILDGSNANFLPTGHLVYTRAGSLFAVAFDPQSLEATSDPTLVLESVYAPLWGGLPVAHYSVSDTGAIAYTRGGQRVRYRSRLVRVDRRGHTKTITPQTGDYAYPRASPDGRRVAVSMQGDDRRNIWMVDIARGAATRFTFETSQWTSAWTPSGDYLAYQSTSGIRWRPLDNSAAEEQLSTDVFWPGSWTPDGRLLAATKPSPETRGDIWLVSADNGELAPLAQSEFNEVGPAFSPDGRFIAYVSDESGKNEVYVQPYPGPGEKTLVSTDGGEEPVWSRDGRELFYRNGDQLLAVPMGDEVGAPEILFEKPFHRTRSNVVGAPNYDVIGDGFIMVAFDDEAAPAQIDVVLNWFQELARLVPTER